MYLRLLWTVVDGVGTLVTVAGAEDVDDADVHGSCVSGELCPRVDELRVKVGSVSLLCISSGQKRCSGESKTPRTPASREYDSRCSLAAHRSRRWMESHSGAEHTSSSNSVSASGQGVVCGDIGALSNNAANGSATGQGDP